MGIAFFVLPFITNAAGDGFIQGVGISVVNSAIANIANFFLMLSSSIVFWTGMLLSISVRITLSIGDIYNSIEGMKSVWVTIRDLSSIFIIFSLLYYSIRTILGNAEVSMNKLIIKIFIAGIMINFSLFFVKIAVDASNIISLQFYNAITPSDSARLTNIDIKHLASVENTIKDASGLSNIFMQSLKLPKIYENTGVFKSTDVTASIGFAAIAGIVMMVVAGLSFLAASLSFIIRTAILLTIMALSPLFFAGMIFPDIKKRVSDKMSGFLYSQCVFMPVYFFLLYVALRIISDDGFMSIFNQSVTNPSGATNSPVFVGTIIQYTIAIIFINLPLLAAIELGGQGMKWAPQAKDIGKLLGGFAGRNTVGRLSRWAGESFDKGAASGKVFGSENLYRLGNNPLMSKVSQGIRGGLRSGEESKYGGSGNLSSVEKIDKARRVELDTMNRQTTRKSEISSILDNRAPLDLNSIDNTKSIKEIENIKGVLSKMNSKEIEKLGDKLKDSYVAAAMNSKQAENIMKSDMPDKNKEDFMKSRAEGLKIAMKTISSGDFESIMKEDFNDEQKKDLKDHRVNILEKAIASGKSDEVKEYMKNLSAKELAKLKPETLKDVNLINNLSLAHLKEMEDTLDRGTKRVIAKHIRNLPADNEHKAYGYMQDDKNFDRWSK